MKSFNLRCLYTQLRCIVHDSSDAGLNINCSHPESLVSQRRHVRHIATLDVDATQLELVLVAVSTSRGIDAEEARSASGDFGTNAMRQRPLYFGII